MNPQQITVKQLIAGVRRRLTAQRVLRGVAVTLALATASIILASALAPAAGHRRWVMAAFRIGAAVITLVSLIWLVIRPLRRRTNDAQIARLVEDRYGLQDRLVSSIEFSENMRGASPAIFDRLVNDTGKRCAKVDPDRVVDIKKSWAYGTLALLSPLTIAALLLFGPASISNEIANLLTPLGRAASANAMFIAVTPGDSLAPRGIDEQIKAALHGFDSDQAQVFIRKAGESEWIGSLMEPARKNGEFQFTIFNIQNSVSYYIEAGSIRSPEFSLTVADLPFVKQLDLTLNFPAYTHLEPKKIEKGGEVAALRGTVVKIDAYLNGDARAARIVISDGTNADMAPVESGHFAGQFTIKQDGTYHIEITSKDGQHYNGTNEYDINALDDHPPTVIIDKPGRDAKVTSIEEVFTQVRAEDDYGVSSIELFYTVNGGDEQHVVLQNLKSEGPKNLSGTHTFFLEEMGLKPGDFISYYAKAKDNNGVGGAQEASSDIYFMEVRPFDRQFKQSQQNGGGDGGDNDSNMLANRQRQIIAATFRIQRDEPTYTESQKNENYDTVRLSQEKLKSDADGLVDRIKRRLGEELAKSPEYQKLTQNLQDASTEMSGAIAKLGERKAKDALQPEQKALQKLIQAQGIFKEIQVSQSKGGQGQQNNEQDLADLFELQLDKMKNQYESVQRQQSAQQNQQQDELAQRLKDLAARQQKQLEQQMRSDMQSQGGGGGSSPRNQQQMIDDARKMARELEKLSRDEQDQKLEQAAQQLQQAADQMQAAQNSAGSPSSRNQSAAASLRAMSLMQQAQRLMDAAKQQGGQQTVSSLRQKAEDALNRQSEIEKAEDQLAKQGASGQGLEDKKQQLWGKKDALANSVSGLANDIEQTARQLGQSGKESTDKLRSASDAIKRNNLPERIRDSAEMVQNGKLDQARAGDRQIHSDLQNVLKSLQAAETNGAGAGKENGLEAALNQARELEEGLDSMTRKLEALNGNQQSQEQSGNGQQPGQQQGRQGQQGQGQQGQQQGQQGQQGQQQGRQGQQGQQGQQQGGSAQKQSGQQGSRGQQGKSQQQGNGQQGSQQQPGSRQQGGAQQQAGNSGRQNGSQQQGRQGQQSSSQQGSRQGQSKGQSGQSSSQPASAQSQSGGQSQSSADGQQQGQGRNPQQSSSSGRQSGGREDGVPAGGTPGSSAQELSSAGMPSAEDLKSELKERLGEAERLRKELEQYKGLGQDMDKVLKNLSGLNASNVTDPNQLAALRKDVLDPLRQLELELARRLQEQFGSGMGGAIGEGQAPDRYRKVIEDYYKRLSQRSAPQQ